MADLYAESQLEQQIEAKIQTELAKNSKNSTYTAEVLRRDAEGTWWTRFVGNTAETPVIVNNVDVSPGDIVYVTVDNDEHISIVNTNVSNPPMSGLRAQNEFQNLNQMVAPAVGLASSLAAYGITPESISSQHGYFDDLVAKKITVDDLAAARILVNDLTAENITAASITSTVGYFGGLEAENITVSDLKATKGFVADLTANNITAQNIVTDHASVGSLTASTAAITGRLDAAESSINSLQTNSLTANSAVILSLQAKDAAIEEVLATKATIANLNAATARIGAIEADYLVADDMTAEVGRVNTLLADYATVERLEAAEADIDDLSANKANVNDLTAATARITTLESSKADISLLESDYITAAAIDASYAQVDFSNVTASWIQNGVIKNGAISNAMINSVSANKLTAGTIDASVIDVTNLNAKNIKVEKINGVSVNGKSIADALMQHESDISDLDDKIDSEVDALNDRIDGAIETFTGTAVPTLSNAPAEDWTDYGKHVGDVYYVVNPNIPQNGYCYRFTFIDDAYSWQLIKDSDVTAALARLQTAEGNIATIQSFDQEIATFKTDTESELSTLMSRTTTLETNVQTAQATANGALVENVQLWYTKANATAPAKPTAHVESTATTGGAWTTKVPVYDSAYPHYFYCYEYKKANGDYAWSTVVHDEATCESQAAARTAQTAANNAQATADKNVKSSIQLWYTKANDTAPAKPTSAIASTATTGGAWTTKVPVYSTTYPKYFYCWQYELADGTYSWSDVVEDKAMAEVQATSRTAAANASSALTQVATKVETSVFNQTKQTVDENSNAITTLSSVVQSTGAGVLDLFSMGIWESGSTGTDVVGRTYEQLKANNTSRIRMVSTSSIQPGKYTVTQAYHSWWYFFDDNDGMLSKTGWKSESEFELDVPSNASSYAVIVRRPDSATIAEENVATEAAASKLRLKYAYASQSDLSSLITTVNNVSQTATSNSASITQLNTTVQKNYEMVASRGEQLVTNGSGMLGDNTNFSSWVYDPTVSMNGSSGSFTTNGREKVARVWATDEFFPVNVGEQYLLSYDVKCETDDAELPLFYSYVNLYDIDKLAIDHAHVHYPEGTMTTLARDLNNGDTEVYLTNVDSSFAYTSNRTGFAFWNYENSTGYAYPVGIYTRYVYHYYYDSQSSIDTVNNKVTLSKPWANGPFPAGTPVSQSLGGPTYIYIAAGGIRVPKEETHREGTIGPGLILATTYPESVPYKFREATAYAKIGFLWNYQAKSNAQIWIANVSFAKNVAAKAELDTLSSTVTYKFNTVEQTLEGITTSIGSIEDTLEEKADGSTLSELSAKVNTVSETVDGHTRTISSVQSTQTTMGNTLKTATKSTVQLWYSKADTTPPAKPTSHVSSTATTGGAWTTAVPAYNASYPNYFYCYEWQYTDNSYGWSGVTRDIAMGETQERARTAESKIDNLEIGGRNLLRNSREMPFGFVSWASGTWRIAGIIGNGFMTRSRVELTDGPVGTCGALQVVGIQTSTTDTTCFGIDSMPHDIGEEYVFSMYARVVGGGVAQAGFTLYSATYVDLGNTDGTWASYKTKTLDPSGAWTRIWLTATFSNAASNIYIGAAATDSTSKTVQTCLVQIEKANKLTDWSPAPEDVQAGIDNAQATADKNVRKSAQLWCTKANSTAPAKPTARVATSNAATANAWNLIVPTYNASYPHYFYCYQYELADGTYDWSDVVYDAATTENQATSRSAASGVSTLTTRTNEISETVDGHTSQITHVTKTANASGFGTIDYSAMGIWESGTTSNETIGKTYGQIKANNLSRIRFEAPMPITQGVYSVTIAGGYQYYTHFFDVDGHLCQTQTWTSTAEGSLTVPQDARSVVFLLKRPDGNAITDVDAAASASKLRLTYAYLTEEDVSEFRSDYASFKQTVSEFNSTIGTTYATKTELSGAASDLENQIALASTNAELTKTASGDRSIFTENAAPLPLIDLEPVYGESVQDGTPTPDAPVYIQAVMGRNLVDVADKTGTQTNYWWGFSLHYKISPGTYTLSFDGESSTGVRQTTPGLSGTDTDSASYSYDLPIVAARDIGNRRWVTFTVTQNAINTNGAYVSVRFARQNSSTTITASVSNVQLEYGSVAHDYVPYGYLAVKTVGKNLINSSMCVGRSYITQSGTIASSGYWLATGAIPVKGGESYVLHGCNTGGGSSACCAFYDKTGTFISSVANPSSTLTVTTYNVPSNACYLRTSIHVNDEAGPLPDTAQLELGIEATEYEPYQEHVTYLDLQGNELHGLDDTYRDILRIDESGHAVIEKRTQLSEITRVGTLSVNSGATDYASLVCDPPSKRYSSSSEASSDPSKPLLICENWWRESGGKRVAGTWNSTYAYSPNSEGLTQTDYNKLIGSKIIDYLPVKNWHIIDLGYVDLPETIDGGTVYVDAEVQPVIGGSWWTKAGYSVGKLAEEAKADRASTGTLVPPYTELEWVESDGTQFVYTSWKPPIATWGFEIDFQNKNAVNTSAGGWNPNTNINGYGSIFGTRNASTVNNVQLSSYNNGVLRIGAGNISGHGYVTDKSRQTMSLIGTTFTKPDGSTMTVTRTSETADKYYANMTVFACHEGVRRSGAGNLIEPSTTRIYSLKFFDGDELAMDLVGAKRKSDGMTGLYDKVADHFYPARGLLCGEEVGDLGIVDTVSDALAKRSVMLTVDNRTISRMWEAEAPTLDRLDDGQQVTVTFTTNVGGSTPNAVVAAGYDDFTGWDETATSSYSSVYLKLTLSDGSKTEWIPCFYAQGTRLTNHYGSGTPVLMTYREDVHYGETATSAGTLVMRGFWADPNYDTNTTYSKFSDAVKAGKNGLRPYTLCMKDDEGVWTSIVNQTSAGLSDKTCYTGGLQLGGILWHSTNATYAAGADGGQVWESYGGIDFRYSANGISKDGAVTTLQLRKPIYLVGTLDEDDGLYYLDTTKWWTQDTFQEGRVYVQVGTAYGLYYAIFLAANNPSYVWDPTAQKLVEFAYSRIKKAESAIVQNADNISMKVSRTDYNGQTVASLINQSSDEIKIQANHVQINGATTFVSGNTTSTLGGYLSNNYDEKGAAEAASAVVTVYPTAIDYVAGTATLAVKLHVNGEAKTPTSYKWTKNTSNDQIGTNPTLAVSDLDAVYNCLCTWS